MDDHGSVPSCRELAYAGLRWRPLSACDIERVAVAFDAPELARWLCASGESVVQTLARRAEREREGVSLLLVGAAADGSPQTFAGLSEYPELASLQTWSYVRPDLWGRGLNGVNYALAWALGHDVLGRTSLVISIDERNKRSVAAHCRLFPHTRVEPAVEPWVPRRALRLVVSDAPRGVVRLTPAEIDALAHTVAALPAAGRWRSDAKRPAA